ncbi:FG-GAP repeat domain-containing protein [Maribacter hydrothermalis]|nr:VCBS repeat-containing protein [Maribacter hydrothermalis]
MTRVLPLMLLCICTWQVRCQKSLSTNLKYIEIDSAKQKWGDWNQPEWLRYFGLDAGDVNNDGFLDVLSGRYLYQNPGGDMAAPWQRTVLDDNVDGIFITDVDFDGYADIIAMALPDIFWYEALNKEGTKFTRRKIGQIPATSHVNSQGFEKAQLIKGGPSEFVIAGNGDIYAITIPEKNIDSALWNIQLICKDTSDEGIGVGDIDGDGDLDIAAGRRPEGEEEPSILVWFENPGNLNAPWAETIVGNSEHPIDRIAISDVDGNAKADIVITEERYPGLEPDASIWWYGQLASNNWHRNKISTQFSSNNLDIKDIDNDGDIDILTAEHKGSTLEMQLWENNGKGMFSKTILDTGKENHLGTQWTDLDQDGDLDIIGAGWDQYKYLHLWRNDSIKKESKTKARQRAKGKKTKRSVDIEEGIYENRPHYLIYTQNATYYLDKSGGGFSRIIDSFGNDYIGFKKDPWGVYPESAASAFRGLPNFVHLGEDNGAGHPGHDKCDSEKIDDRTIRTTSKSGHWQWDYAFYDEHVIVSVLKSDPKIPYWFLYEGTPGGSYRPYETIFGTSAATPVDNIPDFYQGNYINGDFQWAYFSQKKSPTTLFLGMQTTDSKNDMMALLGNSTNGITSADGMTVFGFGRKEPTQPLLRGKNKFIIGMYEHSSASDDRLSKLTDFIEQKISILNQPK